LRMSRDSNILYAEAQIQRRCHGYFQRVRAIPP
jgi:hypothetical protein